MLRYFVFIAMTIFGAISNNNIAVAIDNKKQKNYSQHILSKTIKQNKNTTNASKQKIINDCNGDANCLKIKGVYSYTKEIKTKKNNKNNNTLITKKNKSKNKQKKNINKITKIEFLDDKAIVDLMNEQQRMIITPKAISVRTKNKGVPLICLPQKQQTKQEMKNINKELQNEKDNLKQHIQQSLILNNVSTEIIEYLNENLKYNQPSKIKHQKNITRKMSDFITGYNIEARIKTGKIYKKMYSTTLDDVEELFYVDKEVLLAIWAMETNYGSFIGKHDAFNALYSACINSNSIDRLRYFEDNIISLAILVDMGYFKRDVISSFDGGLGGCQFMPNSVYKFAVSLDGGKPDIINKNEDVLASIGNYLHSIGWRYQEGILTEVELPVGLDICLIGMNTTKTIAEWKEFGVKLHPNGIGSKYFENNSAVASLIVTDPDENNNETKQVKRAFLVYDNYKVILGYNQQPAYGLTAGLIFEGLKV